jgi:hypothetical protein
MSIGFTYHSDLLTEYGTHISLLPHIDLMFNRGYVGIELSLLFMNLYIDIRYGRKNR